MTSGVGCPPLALVALPSVLAASHLVRVARHYLQLTTSHSLASVAPRVLAWAGMRPLVSAVECPLALAAEERPLALAAEGRPLALTEEGRPSALTEEERPLALAVEHPSVAECPSALAA